MARATRASIAVDQKYMGREPEFDGSLLSNIELVQVYNWYNHFKVSDDAKEYLKAYAKLKKLKVSIRRFKVNTWGWLMRILMRGAKVEDSLIERLNAYLKSIAGEDEVEVAAPVALPVAKNRLDEWMPDIEDAIDNYREKFNLYMYLTHKSVPQIYVNQIKDYYTNILNEMNLIGDKNHKDITECYKNMSKTDIRMYIRMLEQIVSDCDKFLANTRKQRKPRVAKEKSIDTILKHFKYLQTFDELKIVSEDPSKIIGAETLYAFNTKNKVLTMFVGLSGGLNINRTTIINYDETKSITKRVGRRTEEVLKSIATGTKISRRKVLDKVTSDKIKIADRINDNTILLRIDK